MDTQPAPGSKWMLWTGWIITILPTLLLLTSGVVKLAMPLKLDDFSLPQLDMSAQDDGSGNVFNYSMTG